MTGIIGARVIIGAAADSQLQDVGTVVAILERRDGEAEWVAVHWDADALGVDRREALDELVCIGSDRDVAAEDQLPQKWSAEARQLADRLESRITDPRFGGDRSEHSEMRAGYALACGHAAELVRQLAADLEEAGE